MYTFKFASRTVFLLRSCVPGHVHVYVVDTLCANKGYIKIKHETVTMIYLFISIPFQTTDPTDTA